MSERGDHDGAERVITMRETRTEAFGDMVKRLTASLQRGCVAC